jgi:hypothetical protein
MARCISFPNAALAAREIAFCAGPIVVGRFALGHRDACDILNAMTTAITPSRPAFRLHPWLWSAAAALLCVPAAAMLITREVNWGPEDFAAMAVLLGLLCLALEAAWALLDSRLTRLAGAVLAVLVFLAVWAELAVGIFD